MATTRMPLDTLPEELLLAILNYIDSPSTLANLSPTTRRLHRLTLPHLYRTFPGRNSELFLRTVSQLPHLAQHVKTAIWRQERKSVPRIDMLEKQHIINRLNELCVPHGTDLASQYAKFGHNDDYWYFEVLLLFLSSLEEVQVRESWLWDDHHYWFKSQSRFFNPLCETRLKKARLDGPMRIENIVPLLTIPTLRSLEVTQVTVMRREGYRVFQWSVWPVERVLGARSSNVEILSLKESYVDLGFVLPVFHAFRALKSFTYEHVPNDLVDEAAVVQRVDSSALAACLATQRSSLTHLCIRDTEARAWTSALDVLFGPNLSLAGGHESKADFQNLHTLDVGPLGSDWFQHKSRLEGKVRVLVDDLPPSLQTLRLKADAGLGKGLGEVLRMFAYAIVSVHRALAVEIVDWDPTLGWFPDNLPTLQKTYTDLGLKLVSVAGNVADIYGAEPLLMDEESEEGWTIVTNLRLNSRV